MLQNVLTHIHPAPVATATACSPKLLIVNHDIITLNVICPAEPINVTITCPVPLKYPARAFPVKHIT